MITRRPAEQRGRTKLDWLDSRHTFSFGQYRDPEHVRFGPLRVINDDRVAPGAGFGTHPHRDMEIFTYVLDGALEHRDSTGGGAVMRRHDTQLMHAGTGLTHSEFNHSPDEPAHFLQVWLMPDRAGHAPGYTDRRFDETAKRGRLCPIATPTGGDGAPAIHQDATIYATLLGPGESVVHELRPGRTAWVQLARGSLTLNGTKLTEGDGAAAEDEATLELIAEGEGEAEALLFDLPGE